jgi:prepilin-type N-terminal cleavage/methylation domain-containing protein
MKFNNRCHRSTKKNKERNALMKKVSAGFTLIELVAVIVILGILMSIAIPKYVDITDRAKQAADRGQLAALRSATHLLYASNCLADYKPNGSTYWPLEATVWAQLQSTQAWRVYNPASVTYDTTSGIWTVSPAE